MPIDYKIRPPQRNDFTDWFVLWNGNNEGKVSPEITSNTWNALLDKNSPVNGLIIIKKNKVAGLLHYILHPTTGSLTPVCYMQDLFISPDHRRKGLAKALLKKLTVIGDQENWNRIYWLANKNNEAAQTLYKNIGVKLDFSLHIWPLGMLDK